MNEADWFHYINDKLEKELCTDCHKSEKCKDEMFVCDRFGEEFCKRYSKNH